MGAQQWLSRRVGSKRAVSRGAARLHELTRRAGLMNRYPLQVTSYRLSPPGWPDNLPLTVAALADLHFGGAYFDQHRLELVIEQTPALNPDLVVLLGDYGASHLEGAEHRSAIRVLSGALSRLVAPAGVVAVLGNHDWWDDPDAQATGHGPIIAAQELTAAGITVLENQAVSLSHRGQKFWVAGLGDQLARLGPPAAGIDDLDGLTGQLDDGSPAILLAHEPDIFPVVPVRYAVTLSGHTHGGQIKVLGRTPVVPSRYGSRYVYGHIVEDDRHLIVLPVWAPPCCRCASAPDPRSSTSPWANKRPDQQAGRFAGDAQEFSLCSPPRHPPGLAVIGAVLVAAVLHAGGMPRPMPSTTSWPGLRCSAWRSLWGRWGSCWRPRHRRARAGGSSAVPHCCT